MKKIDIIIVAVVYTLIYGIQFYFEFYYSDEVPETIGEKYMNFSCFGISELRFIYRLPFIILELILFLHMAIKYLRNAGLFPIILYPILLFINFQILSIIIYIFLPLTNTDIYVTLLNVKHYSILPPVFFILSGVLNYLLITWLILRFKNEINKFTSKMFKLGCS